MIKKLTFILVTAWSLAAVAEEPRTLHVYHIGNSLTRSITMDRRHLLFAEHDIDYQFSTQLSAGCTISRHWAAFVMANRLMEHLQKTGAPRVRGDGDVFDKCPSWLRPGEK